MTNKNDELILKLKAKVEQLEEELKDTPKTLRSVTSTVFNIPEKYAIKTMQVPELKGLLVMLTCMADKAEALGMTADEVVISDYPVSKWIQDVAGQIAVLARNDKEKELQKDKAVLDNLLSADMKAELTLKELAAKLGV